MARTQCRFVAWWLFCVGLLFSFGVFVGLVRFARFWGVLATGFCFFSGLCLVFFLSLSFWATATADLTLVSC